MSDDISPFNELLRQRFGNPAYFEDYFENVNRVNMREEFKEFHDCKTTRSKSDRYEAIRQRYLKLLGQNKMVWQQTNPEYDRDVEVSRIYRRNQDEFLAFMRIQSQGFRAERSVSKDTEMVFHVLSGRVTFTVKNRQRVMTTGHHITVPPGSNYSVRCGNEDQPAYLIFSIKG